MRDQAIKPVVPQSNVCISALIWRHGTQVAFQRPGTNGLRSLGPNFFNEISDKEGRFLYMVRVSIQMESVPTLNSDLLSEFVQICPNCPTLSELSNFV
mgnify:CR=1 FL=1